MRIFFGKKGKKSESEYIGFGRRQFAELAKKNLSLPVKLYHL